MRTLILSLFLCLVAHPVTYVNASPCIDSAQLAKTLRSLENRIDPKKPYNPEKVFNDLKGKKGSVIKCLGQKYFPDNELKNLFWVADTAGHGGAHSAAGGCAWKMYKMDNGKLQFHLCTDQFGKPLLDKHESNSGKSIKCK